MQEVTRRIAEALAGVFGERLELLAVEGSEVAGDALSGFSDLDLVAVLDGGLRVEDAERCAAELDVDLGPASSLQLRWVDTAAPRPCLVPGAFELLVGGPPAEALLHTPFTLRRWGANWLEGLPDLIDEATSGWAVSVGRRPAELRAIVTLVKPTLRAWLTTLGEDPLATHAAPWGRLANAVRRHDPGIAGLVLELIEALRAEPRDDLAAGSAALHLLTRVAAHV